MLVYGMLHNEQVAKELFKGDMDECISFVKSLVPSDFESLNIDTDDGRIEKRFVVHGSPAEDFLSLISEEDEEQIITRPMRRGR